MVTSANVPKVPEKTSLRNWHISRAQKEIKGESQ